MHVHARTRGESNPTVTQLPPGTLAAKPTTVATPNGWEPASNWPLSAGLPPRPPILTSFAMSNFSQAWQLAFVIYHSIMWYQSCRKRLPSISRGTSGTSNVGRELSRSAGSSLDSKLELINYRPEKKQPKALKLGGLHRKVILTFQRLLDQHAFVVFSRERLSKGFF